MHNEINVAISIYGCDATNCEGFLAKIPIQIMLIALYVSVETDWLHSTTCKRIFFMFIRLKSGFRVGSEQECLRSLFSQ